MGDDPYKYFRIEARELVEHLSKDLLELEQACSPALVARLLRYAHTLKGAARVVKELRIADAAHRLEDLLAPLRERSGPIDSIDPMLAELDKIAPLLESIERKPAAGRAAAPIKPAPQVEPPAPKPAAPVPPASHAQRTVAAASFEAAHGSLATDADRTVRADVAEIDVVVDALNAALSELAGLRREIGKLEDLRQLAELSLRQLMAPRRAEHRTTTAGLDKARTLVEELSTTTRALDTGMTATLERARRELEHARGQADQLRLTPASTMFASLARAVRDAARELGRDVRVETAGGDTRLDGSVLEVVQSALFHVVRNAVAHGIEPAVERRARGKPVQGRIRIDVARAGSRVAFSCRDDGAGLDLGAMRGALVRAGKDVPPLEQLGPSEILDLLLHAGVSTAGQVDTVSGRGVGLDVLREAAERLGASVRIDSQPGEGFAVELVVPLTAAAVEALSVQTSDGVMSLPLDAVRRSVRVEASAIANGASGQQLLHDGRALPFLRLERALTGSERGASSGFTNAVIVDSQAGTLALGVNRVVGTKTVVLRRLPPLMPHNPLLLGAALDPLGNPELVLDPDGLFAHATQSTLPATPVAAVRRPVLIIDDSLTTRMLEKSILESAGYHVALACSAEEGLQKAREGDYGLFLVDVEMPGMDGFTFVETTRRDALLQRVPAVLVSSRDAPEDLARGKAAGASGYIVKGRFDQRELLGLIGKLLASA